MTTQHKFMINSSGAFTSLYSFTNGADGAEPMANLVQGCDGDFYGETIAFSNNSLHRFQI